MIMFSPEIAEDDITEYSALVESGNADEALESFLESYIVPMSQRFSTFLQNRVSLAGDLLTAAKEKKIKIEISSAMTGFKDAYTNIYSQFVNDIYGDAVMTSLDVTSPQVREFIKKDTIAKFIENTEQRLAETDIKIRTTIREMQQELIRNERDLTKFENMAGVLDSDVAAFKEELYARLQERVPDFYKMAEDGNFIEYSDGTMVGIDTYNEMATRTTVLNVERNSVMMQDAMDGNRIAVYYLRDDRPVKKEREICQEILADEFYGESLIAYDEDAASLFDIWTVDEAMAEGAMGVNCRHSVRQLSEENQNRVDSLLFLAESEAS